MAKVTYQELQDRLDSIINELQSGNVDIDRSVELYQKGQKLIGQLEKLLQTAKNQIKTLDKSQNK